MAMLTRQPPKERRVMNSTKFAYAFNLMWKHEALAVRTQALKYFSSKLHMKADSDNYISQLN
jgi:hypothetical protein